MAKAQSKTRTRVRHETPISVRGEVDELPPRRYSSVSSEILKEIVAAKGNWVELDPAGRQASSVQSMITSAAERSEIDVTVAVRNGVVYAKAN